MSVERGALERDPGSWVTSVERRALERDAGSRVTSVDRGVLERDAETTAIAARTEGRAR